MFKRVPCIFLNDRGFTLTELLVVVAIAMIMVGFGYSGFSSVMKRESGRAAANALAGHLKEARMLAIEKHASHVVAIPENSNEFVICRKNGSTNVHCDDPDDVVIMEGDVSKRYRNVAIASTSPKSFAVRFDSRGFPRRNEENTSMFMGHIKLEVDGVSHDGFKITLSSMGRVTVEEVEKAGEDADGAEVET